MSSMPDCSLTSQEMTVCEGVTSEPIIYLSIAYVVNGCADNKHAKIHPYSVFSNVD